nr:MAG TPA: hypothetical protein [Caudoviricetes sp.]
MLPRIDSGVASYIAARATVTVYFPVDLKGNSLVCCELCPRYRPNSRRCGLNDAVVEYPGKYIGSQCPLEFEEMEDNNVQPERASD